MLSLADLSERIKTGKFKSVELSSSAQNFKTGIRRIEFDTLLDATFMRIYCADKPKSMEKAKRYNFCLSSVHQVEDEGGTIRLISFPFFVGEKGKSSVLTFSVTPVS